MMKIQRAKRFVASWSNTVIALYLRVGQLSCMFQYYAMLSGGKCARLFGFRSEGGGGGGGRGGTSNPFIDRNAVKEAGGPGGGG